MLRQVDLKRALELMTAGERVKILCPGVLSEDWTDVSPGYLNEYLDGMIFFEDVTVTDVTHEPAPDPEEREPLPESETVSEPPLSEPPKKRKDIDMGKIRALHNAGWSQQAIADEMGVSAPTIKKRLEEMGLKRREDTE